MTFITALVALLESISEYLKYKTKRLPIDMLYASLEMEEKLHNQIEKARAPASINALVKRLKIQQEISETLQNDINGKNSSSNN